MRIFSLPPPSSTSCAKNRCFIPAQPQVITQNPSRFLEHRSARPVHSVVVVVVAVVIVVHVCFENIFISSFGGRRVIE